MTLLIGYASPQSAILATDRMTTWTLTRAGREQVHYKELTTKATFFAGQWLIGFSGVAHLGGETERWLLDQLLELIAPPKRDTWLDRLVGQIIPALDTVRPQPESKFFSLLVVGYRPADGFSAGTYPEGQLPQLDPTVRVVSNAKDTKFGQHRVVDHRSFWSDHLTVETHSDFRLWAVGSCPEIARLEEAAAAIRRFRRRHPDHSLEIAKVLSRVIEERSKATPEVGKAVQIAILPRQALGQWGLSESRAWPREPVQTVTGMEFNPAARSDGRIVRMGVNLVNDQMVSWGSMSMFTGPGSDDIGDFEPFVAPSWDDNDQSGSASTDEEQKEQ